MSKADDEQKPYHLTQAEIESLREDLRDAIDQLMNRDQSPNTEARQPSVERESARSALEMDEGRAGKTVEQLWCEGLLSSSKPASQTDEDGQQRSEPPE